MTAHANHLDDEILIEFLTSDTDDEPSPVVLEHLEDCPECAARARDLADIMEALREIGEEHRDAGYPGDLAGDLARIRTRRSRHTWRHSWPLAAAAALVCSLMLLVFKHTPSPPTPARPGFPDLAQIGYPGAVPSLSQLARLRPEGNISLPPTPFSSVALVRPRGSLMQPRLIKKGDKS